MDGRCDHGIKALDGFSFVEHGMRRAFVWTFISCPLMTLSLGSGWRRRYHYLTFTMKAEQNYHG